MSGQPTGSFIIGSVSLSVGGYCEAAAGSVQCEKCGVLRANSTDMQDRGGVCDICVFTEFCNMWEELAAEEEEAAGNSPNGTD